MVKRHKRIIKLRLEHEYEMFEYKISRNEAFETAMMLCYHITNYLCEHLKNPKMKKIIKSFLKSFRNEFLEVDWRNAKYIKSHKVDSEVEFVNLTVKTYNQFGNHKWTTYFTNDLSNLNIFPKQVLIDTVIKTHSRGMEAMICSDHVWWKHTMFEISEIFRKVSMRKLTTGSSDAGRVGLAILFRENGSPGHD